MALLLLVGCGAIEPPERAGELVVASLPEPGTARQHDGSPTAGYTEEFLADFARSFGVSLRIVPVSDVETLELKVREGQVHLAAYLNPHPPPKGLIFSQAISTSPLWIVQHADADSVDTLAELGEREVFAIAGSAASAALSDLPEGLRRHSFRNRTRTSRPCLGAWRIGKSALPRQTN